MADDEKPLVRVDIGSPVSLRTEIKTEIPKESSGRLLDALTDIIRPFTERMGIRADQIRLQREDVLIEIARKARARIELERGEIKPLPNKFLIPFLEKASTESSDDLMKQRWANLLASAATDYDSSAITFCDILANIGRREAEIVDELSREISKNVSDFGRASIRADAREKLVQVPKTCFRSRNNLENDQAAKSIYEQTRQFLKDGIVVVEVQQPLYTDTGFLGLIPLVRKGHDELVLGLHILQRQGLVTGHGAVWMVPAEAPRFSLLIKWFEATDLCLKFYRSVASA